MVKHPFNCCLGRNVDVTGHKTIAALRHIGKLGLGLFAALFDGAVSAVLFNLRHQLGDFGRVASLGRFGDDLGDRHIRGCQQGLLKLLIGIGLAIVRQPRFDLFDGGKMQARQHGIGQQLVHDLLAPLGIAQDFIIIDLVTVLQ